MNRTLAFVSLLSAVSCMITQQSLCFGEFGTMVSQRAFRYVICGNELGPKPGPNALRNICLLMEEERFSPETLTELFRLLDKRFPEPAAFICFVSTSLDQLSTPEEKDQQRSETHEPVREDNHHRAVLTRFGGNEIIRYTVNPGDTDLKTIVLKGTDPMAKTR